MTNILQAKWKPVSGYTIMQLGTRDGKLQVLVDKLPFSDEVYKKIGNFYYSEINGLCNIFEHKTGTTDGFAGREITLKMDDGTHRTFKGSLWDPYNIPDCIPRLCSISLTDDPSVMERGYTFYSYKMLADLYIKLRESGF